MPEIIKNIPPSDSDQQLHALGILVGGLAHDFNNLLTTMLGYTTLTLSQVPEGSSTWRHVREIFLAGNRAKEMTRSLLKAYRRTTPNKIRFSFLDMVNEVGKSLRVITPETITIRTHFHSPVVHISANPMELYQMVSSLCSVALHTMAASGGVLELTLCNIDLFPSEHSEVRLPPGPYVQFTVSDTGPAISPEALEHLYEPMFTIHPDKNEPNFSLALAKAVIDRHNGHISVTSTEEEGTRFTVYLPKIPPPLNPPSHDSPPPKKEET